MPDNVSGYPLQLQSVNAGEGKVLSRQRIGEDPAGVFHEYDVEVFAVLVQQVPGVAVRDVAGYLEFDAFVVVLHSLEGIQL